MSCRMEGEVLRHIGELEYRLQFGSDTSAEWKQIVIVSFLRHVALGDFLRFAIEQKEQR